MENMGPDQVKQVGVRPQQVMADGLKIAFRMPLVVPD